MADDGSSSYVRYLPPALWSEERDPTGFLGRALRVFEKLLTGIPDGVPVGSGDRSHPPVAETIALLHRVFDPRQTPRAFLPWLSTWVVPELRTDLTEHQQRVLLADSAAIYRLRGTKQGLLRHLSVFALGEERPRVVIDVGEALFQGQWLDSGELRMHPLLHSTDFRGPPGGGGGRPEMTALLHPTGLAVDGRNRYVVADQGDTRQARPPSVWRLSDTGGLEFEQAGGVSVPRPLYIRRPGPSPALVAPVAVTADSQERYSVLDRGPAEPAGRAAVFRLEPAANTLTTVIGATTTPRFGVTYPMDMVLDGEERHVVLDRGAPLSGDPPGGPPAHAVLVVVGETPLAVERHPLDELAADDPARVVEPTALVRDGHGRFIVADAREQGADPDVPQRPANLIRIDPAADWEQRALLPEEGNPLVHPTGLAFASEHELLVCDTGLRNGFLEDQGDRHERAMAEPPAVFRVDLTRSPPTVERVTLEQSLVFPTRIAVDRRGRVVVADRGESLLTTADRSWRTSPHEFGVIVHFSLQRPAADERRRRIRHSIARTVADGKPAHTLYWLKG